MKTYRELMHPNNGFAGTPPGLAEKLNAAAQEGWQFETLLPVSGAYVCALLSQPVVQHPTPSKKPRK